MHFHHMLLCLTALFGLSTCNRVYVHPFNLLAFNKSQCEKIHSEDPSSEKMVFPTAIESSNNAEEQNVNLQANLDRNVYLESYVLSLIEALSFRAVAELWKVHKTESILFPYTDFFKTIVSFYLGSSGNTASSLQKLLGFEDPSGSTNCTSKVEGLKVISELQRIEKLLSSKDSNINTLRTVCLFVSPNVPLSEKYIHALTQTADSFHVRAVDFKDSTKAAKLINEFLDSKLHANTQSALTSIDATANFMYINHIKFQGKVAKSFLIQNHQPFWIEPKKEVLVPMISVLGVFPFHEDKISNQIIIKISLSDNDFLLLVQPINGNTLENIESSMMWKTYLDWGKGLTNRYIHLSLPKLKVESSYNVQDLLHSLNLSELLGKNADFSKMSKINIKVGKVINTLDFELEESVTDPNSKTHASEMKEEPLEIKFDKPFIMALWEGTTKSLLLLGRVVHPRNIV